MSTGCPDYTLSSDPTCARQGFATVFEHPCGASTGPPYALLPSPLALAPFTTTTKPTPDPAFTASDVTDRVGLISES